MAAYVNMVSRAQEKRKEESVEAGIDPDQVTAFFSSTDNVSPSEREMRAAGVGHGEGSEGGAGGEVDRALYFLSIT